MKICPKCKEVRQGKTFCRQCCGELVEGIICEGINKDGSKCGEILQLEDRFCDACGSKVDEPKLEKPQKSMPSGKVSAEESSNKDVNSKDDVLEGASAGHTGNEEREKSKNNRENIGGDDVQPTETTEANNEDQPKVETKTEKQRDDDEDWVIPDEDVTSDTRHGDKVTQLKQNESGQDSSLSDEKKSATHTPTKPIAKTIPAAVQTSSQVKTVEVHFKAIVVKFDQSQDRMLLKIYQDGAIQQKMPEMVPEITIDTDNSCELTVVSCVQNLPRQIVMSNRVTYQYMLKRRLKPSDKGIKTVTDNVRTLGIPDNYPLFDTWTQFDGIVINDSKESKENKLQKAVRKGTAIFRGSKETDAERSARIFGQDIVDSVLRDPEQTIIKIRQTCAQLLIGLRNAYSSRDYIDVSFQNMTQTKLWMAFETKIRTRLPDETYIQTRNRLLILVSMMYLFKDYMLELHESSKNLICERFLLLPREKNVREWEILDELSPTEKADLCGAFLDFSLDVQKDMKNPRWLYLIPFVHFLNSQSYPFMETLRDASHDARQPIWWGIEEGKLGKVVFAFNEKIGYSWPTSCTLQQLSASLKHLFEVDYLLPRTIVAALGFAEIKDAIETYMYPVEVMCAALFYYLKTVDGHEEYFMKCLEGIIKQMKSTAAETGSVNRWMKATISAQLVSESTRRTTQKLVCKSAEIFTWCMSVYDQSLQQDSLAEKEENFKCVNDVCGNIITWLSRLRLQISSTDEIMIWNDLLVKESSPADDVITQAWNNKLKDASREGLTARINAGGHNEILSTYCKRINILKKDMQDILRSIVQQAEQQTEDLDTSDWFDSEKQNLLHLIGSMFLSDWDSMAAAHKEMNIAAFLNWPSLPFFIKMLYKVESISYLQKIGCREKLVDIKTKIGKAIESLRKGNIAIHELKLLFEQKQLFCDIATYLDCRNFETVTEVLDIRMCEFRQFCNQKDYLEFLKDRCSYLPSVDAGPIDELLKKEKQYCELDSIIVVTEEKMLDNFSNTDRVQIVSESASLKTLLNWIEDYRHSQCFLQWWNEECEKQASGHCKTLDDIVLNVMTPLQQRLHSLSDRILSGKITFREMEEVFGELYYDKYDSMKRDLVHICRNENCIDTRIEQLKKYRNYKTMNEVAQVMMELKTAYALKGNFGPFESILCRQYDDIAFTDFEESLTLVGELLEDMTSERIKCLKSFVKCCDLVQWLRESMKEFGFKEFIVFVDLATISAGESAEKMAMVKSLHAGVNAYAPLIFDLTETDDYIKVIKKCETIWQRLQETPTINETLLFANQHLHWFKHVQKTRGEVEVTSFMEANTINEFGIFTIGTNAGKYLQTAGRSVCTNTDLSDVIKLTVPADEQQGRMDVREYCLGELEELQSKLMLVAGEADKGKASVERFTMMVRLDKQRLQENTSEEIRVLDGVIRLSKVYIRLMSSGCVLFTNFAIKLFCEPNLDTPVCVILEFKNGEDLTQLKCRKTDEERLENIMPKVASQMEDCLEGWIEFVNRNRSEHQHLNYFTMDQLVIIQKEIAKICIGKEPSTMLFPLLQFTKTDCNKDDVVVANEKAVQEIKNEQTGTQGEQEDALRTEEKNPKRDEFINKLVKAKYERLVPFALEQFPNFEISKALFWCMKNKNNVEKLEAERRAKMPETADIMDDLATEDIQPADSFATWMSRAMANEGQYDRCEFMLQKFEGIWKGFIQAIISNLEDFISLKHLGVLLRHLANEDNRQHMRTLPDSYDESSPNLVICPTDEVLITTLSVYMMGESCEDLPLPQADEVLMCSAKTSLEQVDVFLRRAIFFSNGNIHCIVNADLMDFYVCEGLHDRLQEYIRKVENEVVYRLIIICGSEKEHSLSMISSLEKYRKFPLALDLGRVKSNIEKKLKLELGEGKSAASVDFKRSTVRLVQSRRSGVGKTLYKQRREEELKTLTASEEFTSITLPLHQKQIDIDYVIGRLLEYTEGPGYTDPRLFHIDVTNEVLEGVDFLLFNLLILGCLVHKNGYVWRKSCYDLYLVETMVKNVSTKDKKETMPKSKHEMLNYLPVATCRSPEDSVKVYQGATLPDYDESDQLFDDQLYKSDLYQKPYLCLRELEGRTGREISPRDCLQTLLKACRVKDPSWSELYHFVSFLHTQIVDFDNNAFVSSAAKSDLPGFDTFVRKFLIQMSKDFSSRSLNMSEESDAIEGNSESDESDELQEYQMRRTWESSPHPYLFFNADHFSFTFIGFYIDRATGNLIDLQTKTVLEERIMTTDLYDRLVRNEVPIQEDFDKLPRTAKIERLCMVMGIRPPSQDNDPDITYELTTDNVKKMMAIYMRFRCTIPVIIMGETGCGKTRLVKFLCDLMASNSYKESGEKAQNMIIVKVHGGTTNQEIITKVKQAEEVASANLEAFGDNLYTVLFFDEANTTESIGLLKEILCDKTMEGLPLKLCKNLKLVAACNPYRRHPKNLIQKLEKAGLGYHVKANETTDRLGRIPLRRLVYRVQPLPQSLLPFVWDFGQLTTNIEKLYIQQMVKRYMKEGRIPNGNTLLEVISVILTQSQEYMRSLKDECSFVSLRDVDRVLQIMCWFYSRPESSFFKKADEKLEQIYKKEGMTGKVETLKLSKQTRALVLALGVCYHACLSERQKYRTYIAHFFGEPCTLTRGHEQIREEIDCCQEAILDSVSLEKDIARNLALKENVFMMIVCTELRIPLFLVGKPGSSKSLARLIVADAMQGNASRNDLFKEMKQVQMLSFQCSPHSTPAGISTTFRQCAVFQKNNNLEKFVSVVVLDEVGLAEDSPKLPLKTLHPLLEDGCQGDEIPEPHKKVGFIGISNWALDPAKMNRGIFVQRGVPDSTELEETAKGICQKTLKFAGMDKLIHELSTAYLKVFKKATETKREFFGLRDFYCLMKMINKFVDDSKRLPSFHQLRFALRRNFSGLEAMDSVDIFFEEISTVKWKNEPEPDDPDDSFKGLIDCCLLDTNSRHLLLLTENYSALTTFQQHFLARKSSLKTNTIFGSSFRRDQEYTQVCRNINRIKVCMETGNTVILLNSENLYESLYEALNQYYVLFGGQRYVDLGLGTHRVKCPVHKKFKLIVVAEKQTVYDEFPIPLINRLEKHNLTSNTMLTRAQLEIARHLKQWTKKITRLALNLETDPVESDVGKVIIGFHDDACPAIVLNIWDQQYCQDENEHKRLVIEKAKEVLLWCATPDAIVRICNNSATDKDAIQEIYWNKQQGHESISQYLGFQLVSNKSKRLLAQVTTCAKLLTAVHRTALSESCDIPESQVLILESLTTFDTEQQFNSRIRDFLQKVKDSPVLLVIQCDTGDENANLIACARHSALDECSKANQNRTSPVHILVIIQLTTFSHRDFKSIQCGEWHSVHIDHLHSVINAMPDILQMQGKSIAMLIDEATRKMTYENDTKNSLVTNMRSGNTDASLDSNIPPTILDNQLTDHRCIDLKQILPMCVQRAISMVRDTGEGGFRITNRISLVLNLLHHTDEFAQGIGVLLARLLEEKDKSANPAIVKNWLPLEAATIEMIQKTGTLRRACLQTFERKLSPVLAGIIAVLDTNKNINILSEKNSWKHNLWVRMLNRTDIFTLKYREVVPESRDNKPVDFAVHGTGFEGQFFQSKMPFSWLISSKLSEILKCDTGYLRKLDRGTSSNLAFGETPIMNELMTIPAESGEEAADCYIYDFVNMMYSSKEDDEMTVVCEMIKQETIALNIENKELSLPFTLLNVHIAFTNLAPRLKYFREINHVWNQCSSRLLGISGLPDEHILRRYQSTDRVIQALYLLIENLSPTDANSESVFDNPTSRSTWLVEVHRSRYVVQQTFTAYSCIEDIDTENKNILMEARSLWNRVVVMQLFVENVCKSSSEEHITIELCDPLWMQLLEETVDMKQIAPIEKIEEFLSTCFGLAQDEYEKKLQRCSHCSKALSNTSKKLPCKHEICGVCVQTVLRNQEKLLCPSCQESVEQSYLDDTESRFVSGKDKLEDYRKRCTVFMMDIVSQLCFSENQAPNTDVIEKLMSYSLESEITSTGVDPSHAFKTFIFKLLIRTSENEFRHQLERYMTTKIYPTLKEENVTDTESPEQSFQREELLLIIAYCIEDNIREQTFSSRYDVSLKEARELMYTAESELDPFEGIAVARICLGKAASCIHRLVSANNTSKEMTDSKTSDEEDNEILITAKEFCESTERTGSWKYLLKLLYRCYGFDTLTAAFESDNQSICWIYKDELQAKEPDRIDRYLACGEMYIQVKEYLAGPIGTKGGQELIKFLTSTGLETEHAFIYLHMAMFWEIALSKCKRNLKKVQHMLTSLKDSTIDCGNRAIVGVLAANDLEVFHVNIESGTSEMSANIKSLVFQWICILFNENQSSCSLLKVLIDLAKTPHVFTNAFLPTMEQDDMHEIIQLLKEGESESGDNHTVYRCKNGHPYVIRDCGRPWVAAKCPCGSNIGGALHNLEASNIKDDETDKTLSGHILGRPEDRQNGPKPERDLKPINCACVRFLLHLTMYAACSGRNSEEVSNIISVDIEPSQAMYFLIGHLEKDIQDIQSVLNLNLDDVLLFCHRLLNSFIEKGGKSPSGFESKLQAWTSKEERRQWENELDEKYIRPIVQDSIEIINSASDLLKKSNEIVTMLSEGDDGTSKRESTEYLCENPIFWMYRVPVTFTHMKHTFQRTCLSDKEKIQFPLLKRFFEEEHILQAIRFIPSILKLQRLLLRKFSQRFYKKDVDGFTVGMLKQERIAGEETERLFEDVVEAWDITRHVIVKRKHVCLSEFGRVFVPQELCDIPITDDSQIEVLLPNTDNRGICSFAMLEMLMKIQNDFLDEYLRISKMNGAEVRLSSVCPKEITPAHLISFDLSVDIQPLVLANCAFHIRDSNIVYEFENFEKQLIDRFVATKSILEITPFMKIDEMEYRTDLSVSDAMMMLEAKIHQVPLTPVMRAQVCGDVRDIPDICQILSNLDITIRVLNVTGGESETLIYDFMIEKLKMNRGVLTSKIRQLCNLSHLQSLWMTLSIQKAVIMITHGKSTQEIFETIGDPNHELVPEKCQKQLKAFLLRQPSERLYTMLDVLYEYIILKVARKQNEEDEEYFDESAYPLKHCIYAYASEIDRENELEFVTYEAAGYDFPGEILRKHCLHTWAVVTSHMTESKTV